MMKKSRRKGTLTDTRASPHAQIFSPADGGGVNAANDL